MLESLLIDWIRFYGYHEVRQNSRQRREDCWYFETRLRVRVRVVHHELIRDYEYSISNFDLVL